MAVGTILRKEFWSQVTTQILGFLFGLAWPFIMTSATFVIGYLQGTIPLAYLFVACAMVFAFVVAGMLGVKLLFWMETPENKLRFGGISLGKRYVGKKLLGLKYGITFQSTAMFSIDYKVTPSHVSIGSGINPKPSRPITGGVVQQGATGIFWEAEVPLTREITASGGVVEGEFEFEFEYGRPGKKRFKETKKYITYFQFQPNGDLQSFESTEVT